ncbi:MAG: protein-L-isoaspartate(D-aspartate) O-methyltransferase [Burkholderiaceae bacterium]
MTSMSTVRTTPSPHPVGLGLDSERARYRMVECLANGLITDHQVLDAMAVVPRHLFIEQGLASRAYEDVALPIGQAQTISKPSIVARMIELALMPLEIADRASARVLEIGTGCGYQAAVLGQVFGDVVSVERIAALHQLARTNLDQVEVPARMRLVFGDGHLGLINSAPFHAIVLAAALDREIPEVLLHHIRIGGRLIAPVSVEGGQRLHVVDRSSQSEWHLSELDAVRFVPMMGGTS